ncbi:MAG: hypothetical protein WCP22_03205, partial [Chlamydiota bacterium]
MSRVKAEAIKKDQEFKPAGARGRVVYEFRVQNAMNVKMVAIKPDGKPVVVIGGENGAGKSNTIRSLFMTLHSRLIPSDPILHGQEKLGTYVDFGDIQAQLCVTSKGDYLKVTAPDLGNSTPKEYISRLVGKQTGCEPFDAQAFAELCKTPEGRRQQVKTLLKLYGDGYDLDAAQKRKDALYQERALVNKDIERLEGKLALTKAGEVPGEEIPLDELMQKLQTATAEAATLGEGERGLASLRNREAMAVQEAKRLRENIARLKAELVKVEHELERCQM